MYDLRKPCGNFIQQIYYNISNYIEDVPDEINYIRVAVQVNNLKRRFNLDCIKGNIIYTYRIYLDDSFDSYFLWTVDEVIGGCFATNQACLYTTVSIEGSKGICMKARLSAIRQRIKQIQYQLEHNINYESVLYDCGWEKCEFSKFKIPKEEKPKTTRKSRVKKEK